ncbi:MAG: SRPBCC family protein, partial [Acidimicrobiales bacterium]|nr:SRPBCC family protein [Acidimicrobiales bacterium]
TWFPGIVEVKVEGQMRVIKTNADLEMPEEILTNDFISRRFQYKITSPMFQEHLSTIDVIELGPMDSLVIYGVDAVPAMLGLAIAGGASGALSRLKEIFEGDKNG